MNNSKSELHFEKDISVRSSPLAQGIEISEFIPVIACKVIVK